MSDKVEVGGRMPVAHAVLLQQILLAQGLRAEVRQGHLPGQYGVLLVHAEDAAMAEVYVAASDVGDVEDVLCPYCGEQNPSTFGECWSCQRELTADVVDAEVVPVGPLPETEHVVERAMTRGSPLLIAILVGALLVSNFLWLVYTQSQSEVPPGPAQEAPLQP